MMHLSRAVSKCFPLSRESWKKFASCAAKWKLTDDSWKVGIRKAEISLGMQVGHIDTAASCGAFKSEDEEDPLFESLSQVTLVHRPKFNILYCKLIYELKNRKKEEI